MTIVNGNVADADEVIESIGRLASQNTNRILKSDTSFFVNEQYSGADDFTDSNGVMNTVDTGSTTSQYINVDSFFYHIAVNDLASGDATADPDSFTNPSNAFDTDDSTFASKSIANGASASLGKTFASENIDVVRFKVSLERVNTSSTLVIESFNGSTWDVRDTLESLSGTGGPNTYMGILDLGVSVEGIRIRATSTAGTGGLTLNIYTLEYGSFDSSSIVETNTIINDIVPKSIVVYAEKELPANTSITVDVSEDGGSTFAITAQELDSYIDTTSFSGSDLALRFNLATTDTSVTPKLFSYGVAITDA